MRNLNLTKTQENTLKEIIKDVKKVFLISQQENKQATFSLNNNIIQGKYLCKDWTILKNKSINKYLKYNDNIKILNNNQYEISDFIVLEFENIKKKHNIQNISNIFLYDCINLKLLQQQAADGSSGFKTFIELTK